MHDAVLMKYGQHDNYSSGMFCSFSQKSKHVLYISSSSRTCSTLHVFCLSLTALLCFSFFHNKCNGQQHSTSEYQSGLHHNHENQFASQDDISVDFTNLDPPSDPHPINPYETSLKAPNSPPSLYKNSSVENSPYFTTDDLQGDDLHKQTQYTTVNPADPGQSNALIYADSKESQRSANNQDSGYGIVWKKSSREITWLHGSKDDLGITSLNISETLSFKQLPLLSLTPSFGVNFLNGPRTTDLPGQLYNAGLSVSWFQPLSKKLQFMASITTSVFTDFDRSRSDMLRITGMGLGFYQYNPKLKFVFGVVYLDRDDVSLLPAVGLIYQPNDTMKFDLTLPKPRIYLKTASEGDVEEWFYLGGEFGGGTWAITRADDSDDVVTLRDFRLVLGSESKDGQGARDYFEIGYVFSRDVEYRSGVGDYSPGSTLMLRGGFVY